MSHWWKDVYSPAVVRRLEVFEKDLNSLCERHGVILSHEDSQGSFIIGLDECPAFSGDLSWEGDEP